LAFDTSAAHCAAALLCGDSILGSKTEEMGRGQAERLIPLLEDLLTETGHTWSDLDAIGVGVGPGNFTGIRIAVSTARGLALGLNIPAIGVNSFDAVEHDLAGAAIAIVPAPRDSAYVALHGAEPYMASKEDLQDMLQEAPLVSPSADTIAQQIAQVAATRFGEPQPAPAPLYVKPADAAPARDAPPVILDDA
jgi:tRNA threonylcarbamoyl adenosine modification protein YeaZ